MTLQEIALEFRRGMLGRRRSNGYCWMICQPLATYLSMCGHEVKVVEGFVGKEPHTWLELSDGRILDPTGDQFNPLGPKVYIGKRPRRYKI